MKVYVVVQEECGKCGSAREVTAVFSERAPADALVEKMKHIAYTYPWKVDEVPKHLLKEASL